MTKENKLVLSTKKSIHPPIEVEVDGKIYQNNALSRAFFDELKKHEKSALGGNVEALYKQVQILYGIPMDILNKLDVRDIKTLLEFTMAKIFSSPEGPKTKAEQEEKKE